MCIVTANAILQPQPFCLMESEKHVILLWNYDVKHFNSA